MTAAEVIIVVTVAVAGRGHGHEEREVMSGYLEALLTSFDELVSISVIYCSLSC